jgi:UrcA family protein
MNTIYVKLSMMAALALATHAATATIPARTQEPQGALSIRVRYDDLNLSAPYGVEVLKRRVLAAASRVCGERDASDPLLQSRTRACVRQSTDQALAQVRWPEKYTQKLTK